MSIRILMVPILAMGLSTLAKAENVEVSLVDKLDGNLSSYCLDISGSGKNANIEKGIQAHTCYSYRGSLGIDQAFDKERIAKHEFYMPEFDVCAALETPEVGGKVSLDKCDESDAQKIVLKEDGTIRPLANDAVCLTVGDETRFGRGGTSPHQIKSLTLQTCAEKPAVTQIWYTRAEAE
ncbi:hypothetical protein EOL70_00555 [Leucothrix sargassi]|nr:hypothetical protein EOL70_00555 [Leucothrix sargassi]